MNTPEGKERIAALEVEMKHALQEIERMRKNCEQEVESLKAEQEKALAKMAEKYDRELGKYARVFSNASRAGFVFIGFLGAGLVLALGFEKAAQKIAEWMKIWAA